MSKTETPTQEGIASAPIKDREHFAFSVPSEGIAAVTNTRHDEPTTCSVVYFLLNCPLSSCSS